MKQDGMLVTSPVSAADESEKVFSPFSFKVETVANKIKTSTAVDESKKVFDNVV